MALVPDAVVHSVSVSTSKIFAVWSVDWPSPMAKSWLGYVWLSVVVVVRIG